MLIKAVLVQNIVQNTGELPNLSLGEPQFRSKLRPIRKRQIVRLVESFLQSSQLGRGIDRSWFSHLIIQFFLKSLIRNYNKRCKFSILFEVKDDITFMRKHFNSTKTSHRKRARGFRDEELRLKEKKEQLTFFPLELILTSPPSIIFVASWSEIDFF